MPRLKDTKVYRGGISTRSRSFETTVPRFDLEETALRMDFDLASKGGGTTAVTLKIGKGDLCAILVEAAKKMPDLAVEFSECAAIAVRGYVEESQRDT